MAGLMEPFPIGLVPWLQLVNKGLAARLNSDARPEAIWRAETGTLALSRPGAYRVIWQPVGGPVEKASMGQQGDEADAPKIAERQLRIRAEIRADSGRTTGLTIEDINVAERVQRAIIQTVNDLHSADWNEASEDWSGYTASPDQRQIILGFEFTAQLNVLGDLYLFKQINSIEDDYVLVPNP